MITSKQIIESLANPESDYEIFDSLIHYLTKWMGAGEFGMFQSHLLFLKRNVPDCIYSGKGYRVYWFEPKELLQYKLITNIQDAINLKTPQIRELLQKRRDKISKLQSWTKDLDALKYIEWNLPRIVKPGAIKIIVTDFITGIDVEKAYNYCEVLYKKLVAKDPKREPAYSSARYRLSSTLLQEKEIIAPFNPSSFQVYSISWQK